MILPPPSSTLFPYTTLFRSGDARASPPCPRRPGRPVGRLLLVRATATRLSADRPRPRRRRSQDRKSTRLNSSHITISYAVFCLKKKITNTPYHKPPSDRLRR